MAFFGHLQDYMPKANFPFVISEAADVYVRDR